MSKTTPIVAAGLIAFLHVPPLTATEDQGATFRTELDLGMGTADEDAFLLVLPEQAFYWSGFEAIVAVPLRFRIADRDPQDDGALREQDWDEPSDYARIARKIEFIHTWENAGLNLSFGELQGVGLGHGAVVDSYFNSTDMDHYQGGILVNGSVVGNGLELMIENVVEPEIIVGRAFAAPVSWFAQGKWPRRLEIGYTLGADIAAPYRLLDRRDRALPVTGPDVSLTVVDSAWLQLVPYLDLMFMDGDAGLHLGAGTVWHLSEEQGVDLNIRGEYRYLGSDYHPAIFNPFYEYRRLHYDRRSDTGELRTMADYLADGEAPPSHGMMAEASLVWADTLHLGARYDTEGRDRPHWVMFRAQLFLKNRLSCGLFYAGQDIDGGGDLFSTDALIGAALRFRIVGPMIGFARFTRRWRSVAGAISWANESGGGVGLSLAY